MTTVSDCYIPIKAGDPTQWTRVDLAPWHQSVSFLLGHPCFCRLGAHGDETWRLFGAPMTDYIPFLAGSMCSMLGGP